MKTLIMILLCIALIAFYRRYLKRSFVKKIAENKEMSFQHILWVVKLTHVLSEFDHKRDLYNYLEKKIVSMPEKEVIKKLLEYFCTRKKNNLAGRILEELIHERPSIKQTIEQGFVQYIVEDNHFFNRREKLEKMIRHPYADKFNFLWLVSKAIKSPNV